MQNSVVHIDKRDVEHSLSIRLRASHSIFLLRLLQLLVAYLAGLTVCAAHGVAHAWAAGRVLDRAGEL